MSRAKFTPSLSPTAQALRPLCLLLLAGLAGARLWAQAPPLVETTGTQVVTTIQQFGELSAKQKSVSQGYFQPVRSPADLAVIESPLWWMRPSILAFTGVLALGALLFLTWITALRRQVQQQTGQIREQLERETRLQAELARAGKLESIGALAGSIAHDFNNLLTVVMGNLSLIRMDGGLGDDSASSLAQAEKAAVRARDLTQQLLTIAKGGAPIRLPAAETDVPGGKPLFLPNTSGASARGVRVLVLDDEQFICDLACSILKRYGYHAVAVNEGAAAVKEYMRARAADEPYGIVILDLTIPCGMGGRQTMEELRKLDPAVKAIVSSGYSNDLVLANYQAHGFRGMVSKPYDVADFAQVVERVLRN